MDLKVCKDIESVGRAATDWVEAQVRKFHAGSLYLPAGATPEPVYAAWEHRRPDFLRGLTMIQIDDILTGSRAREFKSFFQIHLPSYQEQISFIEEGSQQADLAILGLGLNGHVAFHEPGLPLSFYSGCLRLSEVTCQRLQLEAGTWGISYGLAAFLRCRAILLIVTGEAKRKILKDFLRNDEGFSAKEPNPSRYLRAHPELTVIVDAKAKAESL